ncbi:threonylcarbamoyl-AMP synthase [Candidatus Aerophobetes bacterium]|nr:threonylcarbamoyl-AMP synthase [Candidatus Aerophobetes bacterium]
MKLQIIRISSPEKQTQQIEKSLQVLREGGMLCLPTDTVYGLAIDAHNKNAVERIYQLKQRSKEKPLILFPKEHTVLVHLTKKIPLCALKLISYFWPGPLTIIFQSSTQAPRCLISEEGKIGMRIPNHPVPKRISQETNILLATTSANLSGEVAPVEVEKLSPKIKEGVDLIIDSGKTSIGRESTVVDVTGKNPQILREGSISGDDLEKALDKPTNILFVCTANMCRSVMAEAILKSFLTRRNYDKVKVASAGIHALAFFAPSGTTIQTMKKRGIDVSSYFSSPLTSEVVGSSDVIFVMEKKHQQHILQFYPEAANKIWLLKKFSRGKDEEVLDPTGACEEAYQETACELEEEIKRIMERIFEE